MLFGGKTEISTNQDAALATGNRLQEVRFSSSGDSVESSWHRPSDVESRVLGRDYLQEIPGGTRDPLPSRIALASEIRGPTESAVMENVSSTKIVYICVLTLYIRSLAMLTVFYVGHLALGNISSVFSANNLFYDAYVFYNGRD